MKKSLFLLSCLFAMAIQSCSDLDSEMQTESGKSHVFFSVDEFTSADDTRTNIDPSHNYHVTWAEGDTIGIFPREGYQEPFVIPEEQIGQSKASFDGGYWALKDGKSYNAYYPFSCQNFTSADSKARIPVSYLGQTQTGETCGVGKYDYLYSDWQTSAGGGSVEFKFHHLGAFLVLSLPLPADATYKSLTLYANNSVIPNEGYYDLTSAAPAFVATAKTSTLSLQLNDYEGTAGKTATFYMMVPPMDLSDESLKVELSTGSYSCTYDLPSQNIVAAKLVKLTGTPVASNIPGTSSDWVEEVIPYLTFKAESAQTFTMNNAVETLEYSVNNGTWTTLGTNTVTFGGSYGDLRLRGKSATGTATSDTNCSTITLGNTETYCSGDIRTLVDYENYNYVDCSKARFCYLFQNCTSLTTAPSLPATTLADNCYDSMFDGCTSLTKAPELPAKTLANECYRSMFRGCTSLTTAPSLPATTLAEGCYSGMFSACTFLTTAPSLPATTLAEGCYSGMFSSCNSLETAPELPATTLADYCYHSMFFGCFSLKTAPSLPATTLANFCYSDMFSCCTSLTTAPSLPATTLAICCYTCMFDGCTSLKTAPSLPATTLADACYGSMFRGCTSLTTAPSLPATTLANKCYSAMFEGCTSLTTAPSLPATTLDFYCYYGMFSGCTSLTTAPSLPATTLPEGCYELMFSGCKQLNYVKMMAIDISASACLNDWLYGVSSSGTFVKNSLATWNKSGSSGIPYGWEVQEVDTDDIPYLTFKAESAQTFTMNKAVETLEYSVNNGTWTTLGTNIVTFGGSYGDLRLRGKSATGTATSDTNCSTITLGNTETYCSGDIRTLVDYENYNYVDCSKARFCSLFYGCTSLKTAPSLPALKLADYCYEFMFKGCTSLTTAPSLPATTLASYCYLNMFEGCTSLTTSPSLPATTLAYECYEYMFYGCTSLESAPELPATTLADNCYQYMFYGCTSLTKAPELPATTLARYCYDRMFYGCTSLETAPKLPATTLADGCYRSMFYGCTSLKTAPELPVTTLERSCYDSMFSGCTSLETAPSLPATTLAYDCYYSMFYGCTSLETAPSLPATTLEAGCYDSMFSGCTSLTKAPSLPATTLASSCYDSMFSGCTSLETAPSLPATTLLERCYYGMFSGCKKLNYVKMMAIDISAYNCLKNWLSGVSSSGTFVKHSLATWDVNGVHGIPYGWEVQYAYE